ncbi:unnamed protein product [Nippostrongylus brasiliensis]|uniref:Dihydroxyacetone phosphate acyltransferase (inferred by orthology to a human protein) n=1 Tax=Nippostrongylus brasiliensis TaxID=27835 RepID=A0A0N4XX73_NIPBR|nr:unnamed protein product [Nippostrongylus brasiliensis]
MMGRRVSFPEYVDWLADVRKLGALGFAAIADESRRTGQTVEKIRENAVEILKTMAHNFGLGSTRAFGYAVIKVMEQIFDSIYINPEQVRRVRELCKTESVVFMPSHRSYLDFLLLSLFCFDYEIPLPAIAAAMDFANSWFMSEVLRRSGAFYIRRAIGEDHLYWAILSEYVQTHLVHSDRPVEFFVEGTRSRTGKSLHPKYGMLHMVLEPYLRGKVYDIVVVPVTTNYDKRLEEMIYAYELLGFPKPKESTSGLFKARNFLKKRCGRCFVTFGEPISMRTHFGMYYVELHTEMFLPTARPPGQNFTLGLVDFPVEKEGNVDRQIMERSIARLLLTTFANQMMHSIYDVAYVAAVVLGMNMIDISQLEYQYRYIQKLMHREFIYVPGEESESFRNALGRLEKAKIIHYIAKVHNAESPSSIRLSFLSTEPIKNVSQTLKSQRILEGGQNLLNRSAALQLVRDLSPLTGRTVTLSESKL